MEIEHRLYGWQVKYGYIFWGIRENDKYQKVFPEGEFTIDLEGKKISGKKVDWNQGRVSIGKKPMQELFKKDDIVLISKSPDGKTVVVRKKESINQEKLIEIVAKLLSDIEMIDGRSIEELHIAYRLQRLNYETNEIENALKFLSTAPFSIISRQENRYYVPELKKIGLLLQACNKMKGTA